MDDPEGTGRARSRDRGGGRERGPGRERQSEIFVGGLSGRRSPVPADPGRLEEAARDAMSPEAFAYVAGGAGTERTVAANRRGFDRWRIVQRMLRDVSSRDLSVRLFGRRYSTPFLLAPIGVLEMAHPEADVAVARAAAAEEVPVVFSSQASRRLEACVREMGDAPRWFQLYWSVSDELVESFVRRAEDAACDALVITLDTTLLGWRPRDLDLAYLPFLRGRGIAQYTSDPVFRRLVRQRAGESELDGDRTLNLSTLRVLLELAANHPGRFLGNLTGGEPLEAVRTFIETYSRPSLTWDDLAFVRERTDLPIVLKGIVHPADARLAVEHGVDGIVVSNHGGRQVDGAVSSIEMLPEIVDAVDGEVEVLFDSGIRTGADAFKALALGARAVLIGRPHVYGLAIAGEEGVREVVRNFRAELDLTLGLSGLRSVDAIGPGCLREGAAPEP